MVCTGWQGPTRATGEGCRSCSSEYASAQHSAGHTQLISVKLQKNSIPPSHLPRAHYKEYLVSLINAHSLDPASLYEVEELETAAERYLHGRPQPLPGEDAATYHARLLQVKPPPASPLTPLSRSPLSRLCLSPRLPVSSSSLSFYRS